MCKPTPVLICTLEEIVKHQEQRQKFKDYDVRDLCRRIIKSLTTCDQNESGTSSDQENSRKF